MRAANKNRMRVWLLAAIAGLVFSAQSTSSAEAACINPSAARGQMFYNTDSKLPQYCNNSGWVAAASYEEDDGGGGGDDGGGSGGEDDFAGCSAMTFSANTMADGSNFSDMGVMADGNYLYAFSASGGFTIYDATDPDNIVEKGTLATTDAFSYPYFKDDKIYYAGAANIFYIVDVSDKDNPALLGSVTNAALSDALDTYVVGDHAYVVTSSTPATLISVDISNPAAPAVSDTITLGGEPGMLNVMTHIGNYLYVAEDDPEIFNIADPGNITLTGTLGSAMGIGAETLSTLSIVARDDMLFAITVEGDYSGTVYSLNASNPAAPSLVDSLHSAAMGYALMGIVPYGNTFVGYSLLTNTAFSFSGDESGMLTLGTTYTVNVTGDFGVSVGYMTDKIVFSGANELEEPTLEFVDLVCGGGSCGSNIVVSDSLEDPADASAPYSLYDAPYIYSIGNSGEYTAIDATDPASLSTLATTTLAEGIVHPFVKAGDYLFISTDTGITSLDVSNPASPVVGDTLTNDNYIGTMVISGNYLYVVTSNGQILTALNISDPTNITVAGSLDDTDLGSGGQPKAMGISGSTLFMNVMNGATGMLSIDISNPASMSIISNLSPIDGGHIGGGLIADGSTVYLTTYDMLGAGTGRIAKVDVSNPATMSVTGSQITASIPLNLAKDTNYLYVTEPLAGKIGVYDLAALSLAESFTAQGYPPIDIFVGGGFAYYNGYAIYSGSGFGIYTMDLSAVGSEVQECAGGDEGPDGTCAGTEIGGYCWYLGANNQSCTALCTSHAGVNAATTDFVGSNGSASNCDTVATALMGSTVTSTSNAFGAGLGCTVVQASPSIAYHDTTATNYNIAFDGGLRVCACDR